MPLVEAEEVQDVIIFERQQLAVPAAGREAFLGMALDGDVSGK
jgi:hypothetical protein